MATHPITKATTRLGVCRNKRALDLYNATLTDPRQRCETVWALGKTGCPSVVPPLLQALQDSDVEVRREAVWTLARIGETTALAALRHALCDPDVEVRHMAAEAISIISRKQQHHKMRGTSST
ncbi:MAG: HEAT repeat domain-containing protein [Candidatus Zipacnadales bacterium]